MSGFKDQFLSKLKNFSEKDKNLFDKIYSVVENVGHLNPPKEMEDWIKKQFGSLEAVKKQDFLRITNKIIYEGSIFNELRTKRPVTGDSKFAEILAEIEAAAGGPFENPLTGTPEDVFGRVKGKYCITASNVAKYDGFHGLVIFKNHDPLLFSRRYIKDYFSTAREWFRKAHQSNKSSVYPMLNWNCLWKAGASIIHGHVHLILAENQTYARVEELRALSLTYQEQNKKNYFDDIYYVHDKLGLGLKTRGTRMVVKITPIKEKEIMIFGNKFDDTLAEVVSDTLNTMKERLGVVSFNLSIVLPPMEKTPEVWSHMPVLVRIVDRGKLSTRTADIGGMELYAQSIIETNPYIVFEELKKALT